MTNAPEIRPARTWKSVWKPSTYAEMIWSFSACGKLRSVVPSLDDERQMPVGSSMTAEMRLCSNPSGESLERKVLFLRAGRQSQPRARLRRSTRDDAQDRRSDDEEDGAAERAHEVAHRGNDRHLGASDGGLSGDHARLEGPALTSCETTKASQHRSLALCIRLEESNGRETHRRSGSGSRRCGRPRSSRRASRGGRARSPIRRTRRRSWAAQRRVS